jgi:hypothetical protein
MLSNIGNAFLRLKLGIADATSEGAIFLKQFGAMGMLIPPGLTDFAKPSMTRENAIAQIQQENIIKRQASKDGQALLLAEDDLFRQLSLSKVEYTRKQFEDQLNLMNYYGINTARLQEEFAARESQNEEMELDKLIAQRYEAEGKISEALNYQFDAQLMAYKRIWGADGKIVQEFLKTQKVLQDTKAFNIWLSGISAVSSSLGTLQNALQGAAEMGRGFAVAAKAVALAMAIINTAEGVTAALRNREGYPWPLPMIIAGILAAAGAIQIATIASTELAEGGVVTKPTRALIGEAGPEAVIPLKGYGGRFGNTQNIHIEINNPIVSSKDDIDYLTEEISRRLAREAERI